MDDLEETVVKPRRRFWTLLLWALGVRQLKADDEYGASLARYRRYSSWPVSIMSVAVFILIAVKITLITTAFITAFHALNPATVVMQHSLGAPVQEIVTSTMFGLMGSIIGVVPLWLTIVLWVLWTLVFVLDFTISATLADDKGKWWKRHWAGILTALITFP